MLVDASNTADSSMSDVLFILFVLSYHPITTFRFGYGKDPVNQTYPLPSIT